MSEYPRMVTGSLDEQEIVQHITRSTKMIFLNMVGMDLAEDYPLREPVSCFTCSISGLVGLAGNCSGIVGLHVPKDFARDLTAALLGLEPCDASEEDINDAIGELTNILAGEIKIMLSHTVGAISLSTPSIISGKEYTIEVISDSKAVIVPFQRGEQRILSTVQMEG